MVMETRIGKLALIASVVEGVCGAMLTAVGLAHLLGSRQLLGGSLLLAGALATVIAIRFPLTAKEMYRADPELAYFRVKLRLGLSLVALLPIVVLLLVALGLV